MEAFSKVKRFHSHEIPEVQGIYYFRPGVFRKSTLGLRGNSGYTIDELKRAKIKLEKNISLLGLLYSDRTLRGSIREQEKSLNNSLQLNITSSLEITPQLEKVKTALNQMTASEDLLNCVEQLEVALPPIYVGITKDQGLKTRYDQHMNDFTSKKPNTFGGRASKYFSHWSHISYYAIEFSVSKVDNKYLDLLEDLLHASSQPILSLR